MNTNQFSVHIGVDVGKSQLDFFCHENGEHFTTANTAVGITQALKRLSSLPVALLVMEATGRHEQALAIAAQRRCIPVVIAQPISIRRFAGALGILAKTDKLDSQVIARYAATIKPTARRLADKTLSYSNSLVLSNYRRRRTVLVHETYINVDELVKRGFDTTVRYQWKTERAGNFFATLMHTYIDQEEWKASLNESFLNQNFAGFGNPRNRANLNLSWNKGEHGAAAYIHYTGHFHTNDRLWVDGQPTDQLLDIPSHTTFDLQYNYAFERFRNSTLRIGCNNCSDKDPPLHYLPWNNPLHDAVGRFYYIRWQQVIR